jgi:hypothetical protein
MTLGLAEFVEDPAELHLIDELIRLSRYALRAADTEARTPRPSIPAQRILFLQGGIGTGKSTLLHHCAQMTLPEINSRELLPCDLHILIVDLNYRRGAEQEGQLWQKLLREVRVQLAAVTGLDTQEGWERIAEPDLKLPDGQLPPGIATDIHPDELTRRIIRESRKDGVFIRRVARHLGTLERPGVLVVVPDNIDRHKEVKRQLGITDRFLEFLYDARCVLGIIPLREYTLGSLARHRDFQAYLHIQRMHLTTPHLGRMVQKRLDMTLAGTKEASSPSISVSLGRQISFTLADVRTILLTVHTAFNGEMASASGGRRRGGGKESSLFDMPVFLNNIVNSDARLALKLVLSALESWALHVDRVVMDYVWRRDQGKPIKLLPFTIDELLRLAFVGPNRYYDHLLNGTIHNIFAVGTTYPRPEEGKFPILIKYRILQFLDQLGRKAAKDVLFDTLGCFGYSAAELSRIVEDLIEASFLESPDGSRLGDIENLYSTRKAFWYLRVLSKMLVYLENVRNDAVIEYEARPREATDDLATDVVEVIKFVRYIMDQETREYDYVCRKGPSHLDRYKRIVTPEPLCWTLLQSVASRVSGLFKSHPFLLPRKSHEQVLDTFHSCLGDIRDQCDQGKLWPPPPAGRDPVLWLG